MTLLMPPARVGQKAYCCWSNRGAFAMAGQRSGAVSQPMECGEPRTP